MIRMIKKMFVNDDLEIELTSFIDDKQNVWFRGKDVAEILGYSDTRHALKRHVSKENKMIHLIQPKSCPGETPGQVQKAGVDVSPPPVQQGRWYTFINGPGFYELVFSSKLELAKRFRQWVFTTVLPSIRKYGQYKLFDSPWNKMIMIGNETDLHYKVVDLIRRYYPDSILVAGLGENQDTEDKRLDSYKKGYMRGQPDLMVLDYHKDSKGLCIEFKSPTNNYHVSEAQKEMKKKYVNNSYAFILSNDYDRICMNIHDYMKGIRIPCKYCIKHFYDNDTLETHYRVIHRII